MWQNLSSLDLIILAAYFVLVLVHGWWVSRKHSGGEDYFLAGRRLGWFLIGISLYSSNMSGASFIGLMGASYANGVVVFNYEWTASLVLIFFTFFMAPYFFNSRISTLPEFLQKRYDVRSRRAYSLFTIFAIIFIDTAGALYAGGFVITLLFPSLALWQAIAILGVFAGIYTVMGGLSAVVVTDAVQGILLILGASIIFFMGVDKIGGWQAFHEKLPHAFMQMSKGPSDDFLPWPGLAGVLILGFYYWTLNQFLVQRVLGARSLAHARGGALFAAFLKLPNLFIMILPGLIGLILYPELERADMVFPSLILKLLPVGLKGLVITGLVAAIMSSLDSALNAAASLVTLDFILPANPQMSSMKQMRWGRIITFVVMLVSIIYSPFIADFPNLFEYFQSSLAYLVPAVVAVYLGGLFSRRIRAGVAFYTLSGGLVLGLSLFILKEVSGVWAQMGLPDIHYTVMAALIFALAVVVLFGWSLMTEKAAAPQLREITLSRANLKTHWSPGKELRWGDYRWQSLLILLAILGILLWFM